jgi:hypothetical protein
MAILLSKKYRLVKKAHNAQRQTGVVVSFTAIPARVKQLRFTVLSILNGSVIPKLVVLYVASDTRKAITRLDDSILDELVSAKFLEIRVVKDVGPHTKLIYALQDFPNEAVVVCDDDIIYPFEWLDDLNKRYEEVRNEKVIVTRRAHRIVRDMTGKVLPYKEWEKETQLCSDNPVHQDIFPTGTGGVLYPPNSMPKISWSVADFQRVCAKNDDIWFWFCALTNGYSFTVTHAIYDYEESPEIPNYNTPNLYVMNVGNNANDALFESCLTFFLKKYKLKI